MKPSDLLQFLRLHRWAVQASVSTDGMPQAALVGFAVTDTFELVFDTVLSTRKAQNLRHNPAVAFVIGGWGTDPRSVQYEGVVDQPQGAELERLKAAYFSVFPEGPSRLEWPGLTYFRARPSWIRYSDYSQQPPLVVEFSPEGVVIDGPREGPATGRR